LPSLLWVSVSSISQTSLLISISHAPPSYLHQGNICTLTAQGFLSLLLSSLLPSLLLMLVLLPWMRVQALLSLDSMALLMPTLLTVFAQTTLSLGD